MFFEEIIKQQYRIRVSVSADENDNEYKLTVFSTSINACDERKGKQKNQFMKIMIENSRDEYKKFKCPFPKKIWCAINNTVTDNFLPPMISEKRFKVRSEEYVVVKGSSKRQFSLFYEVYGRFKK